MRRPTADRMERAVLVGLNRGRARSPDLERSLDELAGLAHAAGASVVLRMVQERAAPDPATFLGTGKLAILAAACLETDADLVVFDAELTPTQLRSIERGVGLKIVDRTQLILDIFARRARTREGKLQVELAQARYLLPRLVGAGDMLSRLGGGIGTRGPGETKLESDRRRLRSRIHAIAEDIEAVRRRRARLREHRHKVAVPVAALVGYTNAGKTTLFNALTRSGMETSDALFVTLDPVVRQVRLRDSRTLLLSDTVGFIDRLPHALVAAFRGTLEEVAAADLILHVIDAAAPDRERRITAVGRVLNEVGAGDVETLVVYNKCDAVTDDVLRSLRSREPEALYVSAREGRGFDQLVGAIVSKLALDVRRLRFTFDPEDAGDREWIARVYRHGRVVTQEDHNGRVTVVADIPRRLVERLVRSRPTASPDEAG